MDPIQMQTLAQCMERAVQRVKGERNMETEHGERNQEMRI